MLALFDVAWRSGDERWDANGVIGSGDRRYLDDAGLWTVGSYCERQRPRRVVGRPVSSLSHFAGSSARGSLARRARDDGWRGGSVRTSKAERRV